MASHRRTFSRFFLGLLGASLMSLQSLFAQLDPRLQASKTDFLDLYQQSVNLVMKPEVVSVFDFSGSMAAVMYHREYVYPVNTDTSDNGGGAGMTFTLTSPAAGRYNVSVALYTTRNLTNGILVRPDGSLLNYANGGDQAINTNYVASGLPGETANPKASDIRNWIRSASHVRFTNNGRTYDLPICWTILDDPSVQPDAAAGQFRKMYNTYPLKMTMVNPATNTEIEMDSSYRVASQTANADFGMFSSTTGSAPMTACRLGTANYFVYWKSHYIEWLFTTATSVIQSTSAGGKAFAQSANPDRAIAANAIPSRTRTQAVKDASMRTWAKYHDKVFWAYRFLKYYQPDSGSSQTESADYPSNDSRGNKNTSNPAATGRYGSSERGWTLLNGNSDVGLRRLSALMGMGSTTLNSALANTYAQLNDPNCIFNDIETGVDKPVECRNTYVMLFTDGVPNTDPGTPTNTNTPYVGLDDATRPTYGTARKGNEFFAANKAQIRTSNGTPYYNIINLAALAAHGGETDNGGWTAPIYPATTPAFPANNGWRTEAWLPFWIRSRGAGSDKITFTKPRPITTMTVGVSLTGQITNSAHPKRRMFLAATCGEPGRREWDVANLTEFTLLDPTDATKGKTPNSTYFFDATDPDKLTTGLDAAFYELSLASNVNATANPNLPFVGASFGGQVYLGKFKPPPAGGVIWSGDLLMFSTREISGSVNIIDRNGNPTTVLDASTAQWSAEDALGSARLWSARKLYTRLPGSSVLKTFTDVGAEFTDNTNGLKNYVATSVVDLQQKQHVIQFAAGGDTTQLDAITKRPKVNRANIMGDVINSSPAVIEYNWADVETTISSYSRLAAVGGNRFRLLLVGTNQGWLHAFGEVTKTTTVTDAGGVERQIVTGDVEELWSFMPTDFLANLNYITSTNNPHRFMVDGTPTIYHLDLPPTAGGSGNGLVDSGERAVAVFGLRKGGRSYYALNIQSPFTPVFNWALVPDEAASLPSSRIASGGPDLATVKTLLGSWGFSTCTPAIGRIQFNSILKDAIFLGGGFSNSDVEANFSNAKLGRSVLAVDVHTGQILAAADLSAASVGGSTVGPVNTGVIPFEFITRSGMAQRAYFMDYNGGLWSWGSKAVAAAAPYVDFRRDTSQITDWKLRRVFQDDDPIGRGGRYTALPAPFRVGYFPGVGKVGSAAPAAVGIAMVSGDRNNPLDREFGSGNPMPANHRLTVVFDRQDSRAWGLDTDSGPDVGIRNANLKNFSANIVGSTPTNACSDSVFGAITPGCPNYFLAPYSGTPPAPGTPSFGYYINFPSVTSAGFLPKGINTPLVLAGSLFYSYFTPTTSDPCTGGSGNTYSFLTTDVMRPLVTDNRAGQASSSGLKFTWVGVASDFFAIGTRSVMQAGSLAVANPQPGQSATEMRISTIPGTASERFPKPRVWRTVGQLPQP